MAKWRSAQWAVFVLLVFHLVGFLGISSQYQSLFLRLTPFNLLLTAGLLFWQQLIERKALRNFFVFALLIGFIAEMIGVQTGFPFGDYQYGDALGPKVWGTPLVIGVNWFIVAIGARSLAERLFRIRAFQIFGAALLMVGLDFLIEPVAIQIDFWTWDGGSIPWQNYAGWLGLGLLMQGAYFYWIPKTKNPLALPVLGVQTLFFTALLLTL